MPQNKAQSSLRWLRWGLLGLASFALAQSVGSPKINRFAPYPGGLSSGGLTDVFGIAGQPAGGISASGPYKLIGGFSAAPAPPFNAADGWKRYP